MFSNIKVAIPKNNNIKVANQCKSSVFKIISYYRNY